MNTGEGSGADKDSTAMALDGSHGYHEADSVPIIAKAELPAMDAATGGETDKGSLAMAYEKPWKGQNEYCEADGVSRIEMEDMHGVGIARERAKGGGG
jgi:hypothetical protein